MVEKGLIGKLQLALKQKNYIVTVSSRQYYDNTKQEFIKFYTVRNKNKVIYNTSYKVFVVKFLAYLLNIIKSLEDIEDSESFIKTSIVNYINEENEMYDKKKKET